MINKRKKKRVYWKWNGKISKLNDFFLQVTISTTDRDSNLILQPENLYTYFIFCILFLWFIVPLLIVFSQIYSFDVLYFLRQCVLRTDESLVCMYAHVTKDG
jgi:hypothetical protein